MQPKRWTETDRRIGVWSSAGGAVIAVAYVTTGIIGLRARPSNASLLQQVDPYLAVMEILIILFAATLVVIQASVYAFAQPDRKTYGLLALTYAAAFAVLTCAVHFVSLTAGRQVRAEAMPQLARQLSFDRWPSVALTIDLLAWDFFVGLSLLFAAPVFSGGGLRRYIRAWMIVGGALCLAGALGPLLGNLRIQFLGIMGYAFALPITCVLLAVLFRREASATAEK
jgi:hypothetical protein